MVFAVHHSGELPQVDLTTAARAVAGALAGFGCGVAAALLGVAGGELYLPAITVLFAVDVKLAGSGTVAGGLLLGVVSEAVIAPLLVALLLISAVKVWRHA